MSERSSRDQESDPLILTAELHQIERRSSRIFMSEDAEDALAALNQSRRCHWRLAYTSILAMIAVLIVISYKVLHLTILHPQPPPKPSSLIYGTLPQDRFLAYSGYGRLSNNIMSLSNAIYYANLSGRKILVYPPTITAMEDHADFSLSWLQILDLDVMNSYLSPNRCHIQGLYDDPVASDYVVKGINRNLSCGESPEDAPWRLRNPSSWSVDCWLLPWSHTPFLASNISHLIPFVRSSSDQLGSGRFPGSFQCDKSTLSFDRMETVDGTNLTAALLQRSKERIIFINGETMFFAVDHDQYYLPYNRHIKALARNQTLVHERPLLCMHVRREDLIRIPMDSFISAANQLHRTGAIRSVFVITNGDSGDRDYLRQGIAALKQIGCDPDRSDACRFSAAMRAVIEQQSCAEADFFVGSPLSTFSLRILSIRSHETDAASNTSWILHQ